MNIKQFFNKKIILAPMAGVNNISFMLLCNKYGADIIYTAMLDSKRIIEEDDYSKFPKEFDNLVIQIVGGNPEIMGKATKFLCENKRAKIIDINLGCIEGDVLGKKAGAYLLQNKNMLQKVVKAVIDNSTVPVTCKIRSGWDKDNSLEISKFLESLAISAITLHPRTRKQKYTGFADWKIIKKIKQEISIPIIGSGDIINPQLAKEKLNICNSIMIGRSAKGNPFLFKQIKEYINNNKIIENNFENQKNIFFEYLKLYKKYDNRSFNEIKDHALWFFKGFKIKKEIINCKSEDELIKLIKK